MLSEKELSVEKKNEAICAFFKEVFKVKDVRILYADNSNFKLEAVIKLVSGDKRGTLYLGAIGLKKHIPLEEGEQCPYCPTGIITLPPVQGCTCFQHPPCSACVDNKLKCNECHYEEEE